MAAPDPPNTSTPAVLGEALEELARVVLAEETLDSVLQRVTALAKRAIPGADEVSMTLIRDDNPFTTASTGQLSLDADEMQYERDYGPCMDAGRAGLLLVVDDMRVETRWPDYAAKVVERGVLSSASVPLPVQDVVIGALNVYATKAHAFPESALRVAEMFAAFAAVAVANAHEYTRSAERARQMQEAMASRAVIEQAKGIIMGERRCTADDAFVVLTHLSQRSNRKLREVAAALIATATGGAGLPGGRTPAS